MNFNRIPFFVAVLWFSACDSGSTSSGNTERTASPRIKKDSRVVIPKSNTSYSLGDSIKFIVQSEKNIDSVQLEYGNTAKTFNAGEFSYLPESPKTGTQRMKLTVFSGSASETHYPKIKLKPNRPPAAYTYRIVHTLPHDPTSYTQGLFFKDDTLFESTGPYLEYNGPKVQSSIKKVNLLTGKAYESNTINSKYFGEGSSSWNDKIYMLTWTSRTGFIFNAKLEEIGTFNYTHEGWGMTSKGDTLIVSDGSETLHLINPRDFSEFGKLEVYNDKRRVLHLNELEMIDGLLYANVYQKDLIVVIDPNSGEVLREIDMSGLLTASESQRADVLNGIAYNPRTKKIYITGKHWPKMFEVEFIPKN